MNKKIAFLFPGQGSQYCGMGSDFYQTFQIAREVFEEVDEALGRSLSRVIFNGPEASLTETHNSQVAIYAVSMAILRVLLSQMPELVPSACAGFSLGEYSAVTAAGYLDFHTCLPLVEARGHAMSEACGRFPGGMAAIIGLSSEEVESVVRDLHLPRDLWIANFNCPGQVVVSGTIKGIERGIAALKARGAKRAVALNVHGAFHSGLMQEAQDQMCLLLQTVPFHESPIQLVMNVTGDVVKSTHSMRDLMAQQITSSVRWEQSMQTLGRMGIDLFIELGCGKTLTGFHKRSGTTGRSFSVERVGDLDALHEVLIHDATA